VSESDVQFVERAMRRWIELVRARDIAGLEAFVDEFYAEDARLDLGAWRARRSRRASPTSCG
jgi:hypothetical protein